MTYLKLILTNLHRHRVRTAFGVSGIAFGVAAMLTVLAVILGAISMFRNILETDSHYLIFERDVSDLFFSSVPEQVGDRISRMPEVAGAHPVLFGIVKSEGHPVVTCFGVEPDNPRMLKAEWIQGSLEAFGREKNAVFLGERAAEFLEASMGDRIQIGNREFRVGGILKTENGFENGGVFLPLELAQAFFHREGMASLVSVNLHAVQDGEAFKKRVESAFPDMAALATKDFSNSYSQFKILTATAWAVGLCAFLLGGLSVANTMTMSVFTRIREIAILRVCGFSRRQTAGLILGEGLLIAVLGLIVGLFSGFGLLAFLQKIPQLQGYIRVSVSPLILGLIFITAFLTSILGSFYPAWYASKVQPAEALRYE